MQRADEQEEALATTPRLGTLHLPDARARDSSAHIFILVKRRQPNSPVACTVLGNILYLLTVSSCGMNRLATKSLSQCSRNIATHRPKCGVVAFQRYNSSKSSDPQTRSLQNLEAIADLAKGSEHPDLMAKDYILDDHKTLVFEPSKKTP